MKYIVRYSIDGEVEIEAESADEAQVAFDGMSLRELGDNGSLTADDPKTPEQIKQEIAEFRAQAAAFD